MRYRFQHADRVYEVAIERQGGAYHATVDGQPFELEVLDAQPGQISLRFAGRPITLYWAEDGPQKWVSLDGCTYRLERPRTARATRSADEPDGGAAVRAPMPAQVRAVQVGKGQAVEKGQTLLLLEAMKMEIRIRAPADGHVARLLVVDGQAVEKDQLLAEIGA